MKIKNIVLSGGGINGIAHIGAIQQMIDEKKLDLNDIVSISGSSAGAMVGLFLCLKISPEDTWTFISELNFSKLIHPDMNDLIKNCGLDNGCIMENIFESLLFRKTDINKITFLQLYEKYKIKYTITGSKLNTKEVIYFNHLNTPDFVVSLALRISISMPGFFTPVIVNNDIYIDGSFGNDYPMNLYENEMDDTIGFLITSNYNTVEYGCIEEYFKTVFNFFLHRLCEEVYYKYTNTVRITINNDAHFAFDFNLNYDTKLKIYELGKSAVKQYLI
jgi:NTE family protein